MLTTQNSYRPEIESSNKENANLYKDSEIKNEEDTDVDP